MAAVWFRNLNPDRAEKRSETAAGLDFWYSIKEWKNSDPVRQNQVLHLATQEILDACKLQRISEKALIFKYLDSESTTEHLLGATQVYIHVTSVPFIFRLTWSMLTGGGGRNCKHGLLLHINALDNWHTDNNLELLCFCCFLIWLAINHINVSWAKTSEKMLGYREKYYCKKNLSDILYFMVSTGSVFFFQCMFCQFSWLRRMGENKLP